MATKSKFLGATAKIVLMLAAGVLVYLPSLARSAGAPADAAEEYRQGRASYEKRDFAAASGHFQKALVLAPANSEYAQWLGRAYGLQAQSASLLARPGLATRSRESLERAVQLDPENLGARSDLAAYYAAAPGFMGGSTAKAEAQVSEIRRRDPYLGEVRAGDLAWDSHRSAEAERRYLAAVQIDPRRVEAHGRLGYVFTESGKYRQAFEQWDAFLRVDPAHPRALFGLGRTAALSRERTAEGEAALQAVLRVNKFDSQSPSPARAHYYLGRLLELRGNQAAARREYEAAVRLDPRLKEAKDALAKPPR